MLNSELLQPTESKQIYLLALLKTKERGMTNKLFKLTESISSSIHFESSFQLPTKLMCFLSKSGSHRNFVSHLAAEEAYCCLVCNSKDKNKNTTNHSTKLFQTSLHLMGKKILTDPQ